ncbi:hypothetical protein Tco_1130466, partial [Tanacetum coccineum]
MSAWVADGGYGEGRRRGVVGDEVSDEGGEDGGSVVMMWWWMVAT